MTGMPQPAATQEMHGHYEIYGLNLTTWEYKGMTDEGFHTWRRVVDGQLCIALHAPLMGLAAFQFHQNEATAEVDNAAAMFSFQAGMSISVTETIVRVTPVTQFWQHGTLSWDEYRERCGRAPPMS